jgi:hypothetical protein
MGFSEKIKAYFKEKGLTNRDVSKIMDGYNEQLIGRYVNSDEISKTFIKKLVKYFPDIDIDYLIKPDVDQVNEEREVYRKKSVILVEEIEGKLNELKSILSRT